ncbi:hypothetical protein [Haliscomenobacter sp.]|uniref:hypothetical protein n=1 Tax=Haliscomenobacter sp. TaxID=2717303 RepID=UPI003BACB3F8
MELIVKTQVEAMTIHYDIETDGLYLQGLEEGIELEKQEFIQTLWSLQEFSLEKMAMMVKSPVEKVTEVIVSLLKTEGLNEVEALAVLDRYKSKFA